MKRTEPTFRQQAMTAEETDAFLDEMFTNLFDQGEIDSDSDKVPNLATFRDVNQAA